MKIPNPSIYFKKRLRVISQKGIDTVGMFYGYNYDYDDDGREYTEFDIMTDDGALIGFSEEEVESIEIIE